MRETKFRAWDGYNMIYEGFHISAPGISWAWKQFPSNSEQVDWIIMQYNGLKDKNGFDIYDGDVCGFPYIENGFERSKCGEIMKSQNISSLRIVFNISEYMSLDYDIYFIKNNTLITCKEWFELHGDNHSDASEKELIELNKAYIQSGSDLHFIRYLQSRSNLEIIGNIYENPEILPV